MKLQLPEAGTVQRGEDHSVLAVFNIFFLSVHPQPLLERRYWSFGQNPTNFCGSRTAGRQTGKKRSNKLFSGALAAFLCLLCFVVSFSSSHILQDYGK